jgi:hypothetical protein
LQAYQGSPSLVVPALVFCSWLLLVAWCVSSLQSFMSQIKHPLLMLTSMYWTTELCAIIWFLAAG